MCQQKGAMAYNVVAYVTLHGLMCNVAQPKRTTESAAHKLSYKMDATNTKEDLWEVK